MSVASFDIWDIDSVELSVNAKLLIKLKKNRVVKIVNNLQKLNLELCNMVSNVNNVSYVMNKQIEEINDTL